MVQCSVRDCRNNSDSKNISMYRLPTVKEGMTDKWRKLMTDRRSLWLSRLGYAHLGDYARVCSDHFFSGKMLWE
jgi:hypothetical protein